MSALLYIASLSNIKYMYLFELFFKGSGSRLEGGSWAAGVSAGWGGRHAGQGAGGALGAQAAQAAWGRHP